jgi:hypothetical protein
MNANEINPKQDDAIVKVNKVIEFIRANIILKPTDSWQWGYRSALIAIFDIVEPEEAKQEFRGY